MMASPTHVEATALEELRVNPVGTGPYQLSSWVNEQSTVLTPFQDSWQRREDGGPYALLDEFHYVVIPDEVVRAASLEAGDIDTMVAPDSQVGLLLENEDLTSVVRKGSLHLSWWVNHTLYPADNVDFRRALMHAWDKEGANEVFFGGRADLGDSILSSGSWAHTSQENYPTEFNMEKAQELMVKSGIPEDERVIEIGPGWAGADPQGGGGGPRTGNSWACASSGPPSRRSNAPLDQPWPGGRSAYVQPGRRPWRPRYLPAVGADGEGGVELWRGSGARGRRPRPGRGRHLRHGGAQRIYAEIQEIHAERLYSILPGLYSPRYQFSRQRRGRRPIRLERVRMVQGAAPDRPIAISQHVRPATLQRGVAGRRRDRGSA